MTYQFQTKERATQKLLIDQTDSFKLEKEAIIKQNADRILGITKSYQDSRDKEAAVTPIDIRMAPDGKAILNYKDRTGAIKQLLNIPIVNPIVPVPGKPTTAPAPVVKPTPVQPAAPDLSMQWQAKEKILMSSIENLKKEIEALKKKVPATPEIKVGDSGWARIGELAGTNIILTPFEKETISMDPDPTLKFTLRESRDVMDKLEGGKLMGTLKPGKIVTISQTKILQGKVYALLILTK